ncbi:hypothetical protein BCR34DRAFT_652751 [Clohesyomyces aquaticus]|uniref:Uncharacterized protein n=1 Tax=Clohesyomyces aquaticus TaxID=1231657 RepID=A0A1Y2A812_9PLEO|nr:hypothetical protein BCR34DRAFT_652751 [Clohesyomyces aquaticus]
MCSVLSYALIDGGLRLPAVIDGYLPSYTPYHAAAAAQASIYDPLTAIDGYLPLLTATCRHIQSAAQLQYRRRRLTAIDGYLPSLTATCCYIRAATQLRYCRRRLTAVDGYLLSYTPYHAAAAAQASIYDPLTAIDGYLPLLTATYRYIQLATRLWYCRRRLTAVDGYLSSYTAEPTYMRPAIIDGD